MPPSRALHRAAALLAAALLLLVIWRRPGRRRASLAHGAGAGPGIARRRRSGSWLGAAALAIIDALQRAGAGTGARLTVAAARRRRVRGHGARPGCSTRCRWPANTGPAQPSFAAALVAPCRTGRRLGRRGAADRVSARRRRGRGARTGRGRFRGAEPAADDPVDRAVRPVDRAAVGAGRGGCPALAALGIAGIGPAPAIIALILYALLPVVRNTVAGIAGVDPGVVDAARGMGMSRRQMLPAGRSCRWRCRCCSPGCASSPCRRSGWRLSRR